MSNLVMKNAEVSLPFHQRWHSMSDHMRASRGAFPIFVRAFLCMIVGVFSDLFADDVANDVGSSFHWAPHLDDRLPTLGLPWCGGMTFTTLYRADGSGLGNVGAYSHHAHVTFHAGILYVMWSNHLKDEDAPGQRVFFRRSPDLGRTWIPALTVGPDILFPSLDQWHFEHDPITRDDRTGTANGFVTVGSALYALNEVIPDFSMRGDGLGRMARRIFDDGSLGSPFWLRDVRPRTPAGFSGFPDLSDPNVSEEGRKIIALLADPRCGQMPSWDYSGKGNTTAMIREPPLLPRDGHALCEPTRIFKAVDGRQYKFWRDLGNGSEVSRRLYVMGSGDGGQTWGSPQRTEIPDAGSLSWVGNLPDGHVCLIGNPGGYGGPGSRATLTLALSENGTDFKRAYVIRGAEGQPRFPGRFKSPGFAYPCACCTGGMLYIVYSINKEDVELCALPLDGIAGGISPSPALKKDGALNRSDPGDK